MKKETSWRHETATPKRRTTCTHRRQTWVSIQVCNKCSGNARLRPGEARTPSINSEYTLNRMSQPMSPVDLWTSYGMPSGPRAELLLCTNISSNFFGPKIHVMSSGRVTTWSRIVSSSASPSRSSQARKTRAQCLRKHLLASSGELMILIRNTMKQNR